MSGSRKASTLGLPAGFKAFSAFPFGGINQSASRIAIDDKEFFWLENFTRNGDGALRTLWDAGTPLYTATGGKTIISFFWFNIGSAISVAVFFTDGTAVQVSSPSGVVSTISSTPGTFYSSATPGLLPACSQYGTQYLLIANRNTANDYWVWDGSLLYGSGGISPAATQGLTDGGSGYTSVPTYTVFGGSGSGVVLTPVIAAGSVVSLTVDNAGSGYLPGEGVQVAFSGGGSDSSAILTAVLATGVVQFLTLVDGGSGYPTGTFPLAFSGSGTGAAGTFTTSGGQVTSVALTGGGSGYTSTPTVSFPIPGSGAVITATEVSGTVTLLSISNGGSGYTPGTYPLVFTGSGSGAQATVTANASGVMSATDLIAGGTGYSTAPTVAVSTGSGATVVAAITAGAVASVTVTAAGSGFTGTPTLTIQGGNGTGALATAVVTSGSISSVTVTNGGSGYTSTPTVLVQTAVNNAAAATLSLMPFGVSGVSIETYQQRVFLAYPNQQGKTSNGGTEFISAPGSLTDFATSDGGDIFSNTDRFLRQQYTFLRQTANFLYCVGDSSVSVISNIQTSGNPPTTTFSYQNTDPQTGSSWRDSAQDFSNIILFANAFGVYGIYGGSVRKVSEKMDDVFTAAVLPPTAGALTPSGATANIYSRKHYLLLMTITDPFTALPRNVMLVWDQKEWYIASQTPALTYIGTQEVNSNITAWGTDGTSLYPLLNRPSSSLPKIIATKLWGGAQSFVINMAHSFYLDAVDNSAAQGGISFNSATISNVGLAVPMRNSETQKIMSVPTVTYPFPQTLEMQAPFPLGSMLGVGAPQVPGLALGVNLTSTSPDFTVRNITLGYVDYTGVA